MGWPSPSFFFFFNFFVVFLYFWCFPSLFVGLSSYARDASSSELGVGLQRWGKVDRSQLHHRLVSLPTPFPSDFCLPILPVMGISLGVAPGGCPTASKAVRSSAWPGGIQKTFPGVWQLPKHRRRRGCFPRFAGGREGGREF